MVHVATPNMCTRSKLKRALTPAYSHTDADRNDSMHVHMYTYMHI